MLRQQARLFSLLFMKWKIRLLFARFMLLCFFDSSYNEAERQIQRYLDKLKEVVCNEKAAVICIGVCNDDSSGTAGVCCQAGTGGQRKL